MTEPTKPIQISNAPEPITPVTGRSSLPVQKFAAPHLIDWPFWRNMRTVKLWQACALVVGIDPDRLEWHPQAWMAGPGNAPVFVAKSFPSKEANDKFDKAWRLAENAVSYMDGPIFPKGTPSPANRRDPDVLLSEVAAFFLSCEWPIPEPLKARAQSAAPVVAQKAESMHTAQQQRELDAMRVPRANEMTISSQWLTNTVDEHLSKAEPKAGTLEDGAVEVPDSERRLAALRALGGTVKYRNGEWKFTGMALLVKNEQGRKRNAEKTIRLDLREAAQAEREATQAGAFMNGLGRRDR